VYFVEQVGYKTVIFYNLSPLNGWTNRGSEPYLGHHVDSYFEEKLEDVGRMFVACGVCI
jgi:hypothetical protein